jgi:hypothetical protein
MERFPVELLYVLAFVGFVLFNYMMQRAVRRRQQEEEAQAQAAPQPAPPAPEDGLAEDVWGRTPSPAPAPAPAPVFVPRPAPPQVRAEPPAPRRLHPARALLEDKRDLRRAVILMMVLGPCRSQEPPERIR